MAKKSDSITVEELAKHIDHSLLRPELTEDDVVAGCATAKQYNVASVCVRPCDVRLAADLLKGTKHHEISYVMGGVRKLPTLIAKFCPTILASKQTLFAGKAVFISCLDLQ